VINLQKRILERQKQSTHLNFWLEGHSGPIYCLAASSDFKYLASGGEDKILKFWDLSTRKHLRDLAGHTWPITAIRLSGDGSHALSGSYDGTARFWNTFTGTPIKSLGFGGILEYLDLDRDGTYAVFGKDQMLQFGNLFSDTLSSTNDLGIRPIPVRILTIGRLVISGAENYSICEWQLPSGQLVRKFKGHTSLISALCISRNKLFFLSGSMDKSIKLWDVSSGECILTMQAHEQIDTINVSADMKHALSGGNLSTRLWDLETGRCLRTFSCEKGGRSCLSEDGQQAVIANGNRLACWNISPPYEYVPAAFTLSRVSRFELILDRQDVYQKAFADAREAIKAGNIIEGMKQLYIARQQPGFSRHETAFREWQGLYTSLPCKGLRDVWNVRTFEHSTKGASHQISCAAISQDGTVGISGGGREDQNVYVWDLTNGKRIFTLNHGSSIDAIWLNQDAAFALTTGGDQVAQKNSRSKHSIKLWNLRTGEFSGRIPHPMLEGHQQPINCLDVSADGRLILSGSWDGSIRLWDLMNYGKCLRIFSGHKGWVTSIRFSGDGKQALSVAGSQFKRWDIASGRCLQTIDRAAEIEYDEFFLVRTDLVLARGSLKGGQRKSIVELRDLATDQQIRIFEGYRPSSLTASMNGKLAIIGSYNGNLYFVDLPSGEKIISVAGHTSAVNSVDISENGSYAISAGEDGKLKLWALDWDLEAKEYADWDDRATPYLQDFITYHTPYSANLPSKYQFTDDEVFRALTHRGKPAWTEADFQRLLYTLGCAGYGWLRPEGVRKKLEELMREIQG
jgi:WD40 repeat protein